MKNIATTLTAVIMIATLQWASAQQTEVKIPATPGNYNVTLNADSNQLVMRSYTITTMNVDNRANIVAGFIGLLRKDGRNGGAVKTAIQKINGKEVIILIVTATEKMQQTIAQIVEQINKGEFVKFSTCPTKTHYQPKFRSAEALAKILEKEITEVGTVYFDNEINLLTIEDDPIFEDYFMSIIQAHDIPPQQIAVEVTIVETKKGVDRDLGIYWDAWKKVLPTNVSLKLDGQRAPTALSGLRVMSFETLLTNISPQALTQFLNYLQQEGKANIHSKTTLNVVNAKPAVFRAGKEIPFRLLTKQGATNELDNQTAFEGLELNIQSVIGKELKNLFIQASSTSMVGYAENGAPLISTSKVNTSVEISGEKVFTLSGLEATRLIQVSWGIPVLEKIPLLKNLFSWERKSEERWDVTVIVHVNDL